METEVDKQVADAAAASTRPSTPHSIHPLPPLSPIERNRTTADEVEDRLILAIARGDIAPGKRITEAEIAAALNVSRVPAREAMQKLLLRGILVGGAQRGLRVADYGKERIAELFELRFAIERIFFQHVMRSERSRAGLIAELKSIVGRMRELSGSGDPILLSAVDLDFHRAVARHSGNVLAAQIWEGLAQHMFIVFCRDWSSAADRTGEVRLHERLVEFLRTGSPDEIDDVLRKHFSDPSTRSAARKRR
ncbi:GntR family transcriptional regulator [Mesorhizobium sp. BAC0120]|uniref:GntR family transcriptional regulator n=1 Tax=Mesorhizobium sp. BAC0120 TaxID=3090670 RepID=UPI00298C320F|nr:GntR family transcriptional regulator [Mesorhizobium sp. BAC0120]MDW6023559.1 GntR family transcriptional regulator [Mesorhizobium sp. BAC0120]